jgi:arylsulfatase A-like enzyme
VKQRLCNLWSAVRACALAALVLAPVEVVLTVALSEGEVEWRAVVKLLAVAATLLPLAAGIAGLVPGIALLALGRPAGPALRGLVGGGARTPEEAARGVERAADLVASLCALGVLCASLAGASFVLISRLREPLYQSLGVGLLGLPAAALALGVRAGLRGLLVRVGRARWPLVSAPLSSPRAASILALLLALTGATVGLGVVRSLREVVPVRLALSLFVLIVFAAGLLAWRGERRFVASRPLRRGVVLAWVALLVWSLISLGADPTVKYLMTLSSPALERSAALVRVLTDVDGDGYGVLLGEGDCAPFNRRIHPGAMEIPDNGVDDDCVGGDFSYKRIRKAAGKARPVPDSYRKPYNILLITLDAVRADHTGFGGYVRPTTPKLDRLARESATFVRAYSPSAGTVASMPAILSSRFFHSQLAVGPERPKAPPLILPENLMVAEIMKAGGYRTGAVTGHDYFNQWGVEQGFDHFDNSLGPRRDPHSVTSDKLTDKATAYVAAQGNRRWFLWVHYLDAHSEYEPHPEFDFGKRQVDLYDGEIRFVDEHVGRLLDFLMRSPVWSRTVVAVTADHGDAFGEHGRTHHGSTLYEEMIHVPLLLRVPDLPGRRIDQVVTNLDTVPTLVELAGLGSPAHDFEGKSLVPLLFYDEREPDRAVFAETNWPSPLRAMVQGRYKLVYDMKNNLYQVYDLGADPAEKQNLAGRQTALLDRLKATMWDWLSRAVFRRTQANQAERVRAADILDRLPPGARPIHATFDGALELLGYELDAAAVRSPGAASLVAYLRAPRPVAQRYRLFARADLRRPDGRPSGAARDAHAPLGGFYPTSVWKPEELIREHFTLKIPARWTGDLDVVLGVEDEAGKAVSAAGDQALDNAVRLATIPLAPVAGQVSVPDDRVPSRAVPPKPSR